MPATCRRLELSLLPKKFAICRLAATALLLDWATAGEFYSVTRTSEELSIVAEMDVVPEGMRPRKTHRMLKVHGPFELSEIGVLAALVAPLAQSEVSVFTISTFNTDYLLIDSDQLRASISALRGAGHLVYDAEQIS